MSNKSPVTKVIHMITRDNGSQVKITVERFQTPFSINTSYTDTMVHHRENEGENWKLCGDRKHPNWRDMSVDEYVKKGRPEMFYYASIGEILKVNAMLG